MIGLLFYVCMSATGLTLIKIGTMRESAFVLSSSGFTLKLNWILVLGLFVYVCSFLTSIIVMRKMNLSVFYPLSAGLVYILVSGAGYFVLHESITLYQLFGMAIILIGIIVMNFGKV